MHMADTRLRASGAMGSVAVQAARSLPHAARVGGRGREQAAPATKEQKLKNARLNAATSRSIPLEHHRHSSTSRTDVQARRLLSGSCGDARIFARLQAVAPSSSLVLNAPPSALASHTSALAASAAQECAAATSTGSSRPKYSAENVRNTTAWRSLTAPGTAAAGSASSSGATSSATHAPFISGVSALASGCDLRGWRRRRRLRSMINAVAGSIEPGEFTMRDREQSHRAAQSERTSQGSAD